MNKIQQMLFKSKITSVLGVRYGVQVEKCMFSSDGGGLEVHIKYTSETMRRNLWHDPNVAWANTYVCNMGCQALVYKVLKKMRERQII